MPFRMTLKVPRSKSAADQSKRKEGAAGSRFAHVRVLTSPKKRTVSSKKWLLRQLNDPYVVRAKAEGFRSRAAFKLLEIDEKYRIFQPHQVIVDLGCAPGGWLQVAAKRSPQSLILGVDLQDISPLDSVIFLKGDFTEEDTVAVLQQHLQSRAVDVVLSDMAASACGIPKVDYIRIVTLVQTAATFALQVLAPGGVFVAKVLRGGTPSALLAILKQQFQKIDHFKPPASRADSAEIYIVARDFRG